MKVLLGALPAYMTATGWGFLLAGVPGLLVSIAVLAPCSAFGVVILYAQQRKYEQTQLPPWRRSPVYDAMSHPIHTIDK